GTRLKLPKIKGAEFTSAEKVIVDSLFGRYLSVRFHEIDDQDAGMSGDRVLRAHTELSRKGEKENSCLLKIGAKYRLAVEREKMAAYVQNRLHPRYHPQVLGFASGRTDAGMRLSWASGDDEELFSLRRIFTDAEYSCERLEYEINRLMTDVLKGWYIDNVHMRQIEIYKLLKKYADKLVGVTLADGTVLDRTVPELEFPEINRCIRNPILVMDELVKSRGKESVKVPVGLHHGDLNSRNVLLDSGGHICLIDFYKSGRGVIFQDAARLEVDLRYEALNTMEKFHRSEYLIELTWMDSFLVASSFKNIEKVDVRRSMEKRLRSALQLRKVMSSMYNMPEKVFAPIYKCSLLSALIRLLGYGYLKDELVKLALVEISDLSERLLAEG
ncbi:MAG: phosphotransferase, partial [Candidatus Lindowbacteria bacterium]|nr:phosphotransferase [Candidatus Lindowbacteria bacterium]